MPSSEMRAFKFVTEKLGKMFSRDRGMMDSFNAFVRLERAEARREAIEDLREIQLSVSGMTELEEAFAHQKKFSKGDANGIAAILEVLQLKLRSKLAAPEKEETNVPSL